MDPYAVLGLTPDATEGDVARAYRDLAKQWHPDLPGAGGAEAHARMAQLNAAYDEIRFGGRSTPGDPVATQAPPKQRRPPGHWLSDRVRQALPREVLDALTDFEDVRLVARVTTWQSPSVVLAVTEGRLLWAPQTTFSPRVHVLRHTDVARVEHRVRRPLRRRAVVRLVTTGGRKFGFGDLDPATASLVATTVAQAAPTAV